jgi:hypothetical protein
MHLSSHVLCPPSTPQAELDALLPSRAAGSLPGEEADAGEQAALSGEVMDKVGRSPEHVGAWGRGLGWEERAGRSEGPGEGE